MTHVWSSSGPRPRAESMKVRSAPNAGSTFTLEIPERRGQGLAVALRPWKTRIPSTERRKQI